MSEQTALPEARIIGGPVCTRTADRSLHVNLLPASGRLCSFNCVYCPFPREQGRQAWPAPGDIGAAVMNALHDAPHLESITVSGPGEPTRHPRFGHALGNVLSARQVRPELPVRVVTNGASLRDLRIRRLVEYADERLVRLDAGGDRIARPERLVPHEEIAAALRSLSDFSVEAVFVEGPGGNTNWRDVNEWIERLAELRPKHVTVTTIAEPPLDPTVTRADAATLERITTRLHRLTGLAATALP